LVRAVRVVLGAISGARRVCLPTFPSNVTGW